MPPPELIDLSKESLALVRKGGIVFHHSQALHTSHRNESDRWRRGYATHWVTSEVTSSNGTLDKAYFRRDGLSGGGIAGYEQVPADAASADSKYLAGQLVSTDFHFVQGGTRR